MGLKDDFKKAKDEAEIATIFQKSTTYTHASEKTKRQWERLDHRRRDQLKAARAAEMNRAQKKAKAPAKA